MYWSVVWCSGGCSWKCNKTLTFLLTYDKVHNPLRLPTFRPSGALNHWKNTVFRDFPTFSRICIFFLLTLSLLLFFLLIFLFSLPLPCSAFHLSILSEVWLLNFLRLYEYIPTIAPLFPQSYHHHLPGWRSWKKTSRRSRSSSSRGSARRLRRASWKSLEK